MKSGMLKTECHELTDAELGRVAGGFNSLAEFGNLLWTKRVCPRLTNTVRRRLLTRTAIKANSRGCASFVFAHERGTPAHATGVVEQSPAAEWRAPSGTRLHALGACAGDNASSTMDYTSRFRAATSR